jgi:hypothetical protein
MIIEDKQFQIIPIYDRIIRNKRRCSILKKWMSIVLVMFLAWAPIASAHPGRTDSKGGHTCWTNCEKWGLEYGEYHYHNGGSSSSSESSSVSNVDYRSSEEKEADNNVWLMEFYKNQGSYYNAFFYMDKVHTSGYSYKVSGDRDDLSLKVAGEAYSLYVSGDLAASLQYYTLLAGSKATPTALSQGAKTNIQLISAEISFKNNFSEAIWYFDQGSYVNGVLLASKKIDEGYDSELARSFMEKASTKLLELAYSSFVDEDYEYSYKCYTVLSWIPHVPTNIKDGAVTNLTVVKGYMK